MKKSKKNPHPLQVVEIDVIREQNYHVISANGIFANISPAKKVCCDFFYDASPFPQKFKLTHTDEGTNETPFEINNPERRIPLGVVMDPEVAYGIGQVMIQAACDCGYRPQKQNEAEGQDEDLHSRQGGDE